MNDSVNCETSGSLPLCRKGAPALTRSAAAALFVTRRPSESPNSSCGHTLRAITDPACGNISLSISRANYEVYWHAVSVPTRSCLLPSDPIDAVRRFLSRHRRERRRGKASVVVIWRNSCPLKSQSSFLQGRLLVITKPTTFKDGVGLRLRFTETGNR